MFRKKKETPPRVIEKIVEKEVEVEVMEIMYTSLETRAELFSRTYKAPRNYDELDELRATIKRTCKENKATWCDLLTFYLMNEGYRLDNDLLKINDAIHHAPIRWNRAETNRLNGRKGGRPRKKTMEM